MLTRYLTDIEDLLEQQHWEAALREAGDLPRIAVALADPGLQASREAVHDWAEQWLKPEEQTGVVGSIALQAVAGDTPPVPTGALRRLQLRRHVRSAPRGYPVREPLDPQSGEAEGIEATRQLVSATRRWYAHSGCHDPAVQANLARLAVLR
ncbi:MAG: hypothetical protein JOZ67_10285 [Gammaproteobacteria bacterium]|nr:hypothetical protein [Gammaproteobacteria bacterium]MBV9698040.1 hypothetical protein [Gammaproteobacteria bacterium]